MMDTLDMPRKSPIQALIGSKPASLQHGGCFRDLRSTSWAQVTGCSVAANSTFSPFLPSTGQCHWVRSACLEATVWKRRGQGEEDKTAAPTEMWTKHFLFGHFPNLLKVKFVASSFVAQDLIPGPTGSHGASIELVLCFKRCLHTSKGLTEYPPK